jgi:signal transduction histidine kinase
MNELLQPSETPQVLIVDDVRENVHRLSQLLIIHGYQVHGVTDGEAALKVVQTFLPDLILLDVLMPGLDGYEVCRRLKADDRTRDVPVVFLSALGQTEDKIKAFRAGGVDYILRPFQTEEVLARVNTHVTLRRLQRDLNRQIAELREQNAELDAFAHTVAHDLKNPLQQVIGYAETLVEFYHEIPSTEVLRSLASIARGGRKMHNIIEELLLLAGVRKTEVELGPLEMDAIVGEAARRLEELLKQSGASLKLPATWPPALGYAPWIEEVWVNYLSNGCKYGGQPPELRLGGDVLPTGMARFWVKDNGRGLQPDQQARLFVPFTRLEQTRATGYGLGLSVVRRIIEKQGGEAGVVSSGVPGEGSLFYFTLPGARA